MGHTSRTPTPTTSLKPSLTSAIYHLKDWVKKDPVVSSRVDVEDFIQKTPVLRIVADYCNSLKHAGLDRKSRSGGQVEAVNTHLKMDRTPKGFVTSAQLEIRVGGKRYNAYRLATDSVAEWRRFFIRNSINIDEP
jgi:hypothetical protein